MAKNKIFIIAITLCSMVLLAVGRGSAYHGNLRSAGMPATLGNSNFFQQDKQDETGKIEDDEATAGNKPEYKSSTINNEPSSDEMPGDGQGEKEETPPASIPVPPVQEIVPEPVILPDPTPPKYPPVCGGCGHYIKNGPAIQCPMYESSMYVCAL